MTDSLRFRSPQLQSCLPCPVVNKVAFRETNLAFDGENGELEGHPGLLNLVNGELFGVNVILKSKPSWIVFSEKSLSKINGTKALTLYPGEEVTFDIAANAEFLEAGTARGAVTFGVLLDRGNAFAGCVGVDATTEIIMRVSPKVQVNTPDSILWVGYSLMTTIVGVAIGFAGFVWYKRKNRVIRGMQPIFLVTLCSGIIIIATSIIPYSLEDTLDSQEGRDIACMAFPWLLSLGFTVTLSALFAKLWRINKLFERFKRITVTVNQTLAVFSVMFGVNFALLLLWTLIDPLRWEIRSVQGEDWNKYGVCTSSSAAGKTFLGLTVILNFGALILACYQAYRARNIEESFSESKNLGMAIFSWVQIVLVGFPVLFLINDDNSNARYFLQVSIMFTMCMAMLLLIFVPLILQVKEQASGRPHSSVRISGLNPTDGPSKNDVLSSASSKNLTVGV